MKPSIVIAALLLASFRWSSGFSRVEVAPGEDAVLTCRNVSGKPVDMFWARLINGNYSCVASNTKNLCSGIRTERFETSSNKSFVSLKIKDVKVDDSGFYFRGFNVFGTGEIELVQLSVEDLKSGADNFVPDPKDKSNCENSWWIPMALGGLSVLLLMAIVGLAFKVQKLQNAQSQEHNGPSENLASDNLNYATVNFQPKARRTRRAFHNDPNVIYAATR